MSWLYVPGLEALNSDSNSHLIFSENAVASSLRWRGKPQQLEAWSRQWKRGGFIRLLSGLTCEPSTLDAGVDALISSLRETRARATPWRESGSASSTIAGCLIGQSTSFPPAGLRVSSARTSRGTQTGNSPLLSKHWKDWAAALRAEYSARPKPATPCDASDCSSWPSASIRNHHAQGASRNTEASANSLGSFVEQEWMAPQVPNGGRSTAHAEKVGNTLYHGDKKVQLGLESRAKSWSSPKASDPEKAGPNMRGSKGDVPLPGQAAQSMTPCSADVTKVTLATKQYSLIHQAHELFHPPSSPAPAIAGGSMSSTDSPNSNQPSAKRKLNPIFVEALMRWPTGLSGFERQETAWTRWWQLQHSYLLALASGYSPRQRGLFE
jgi:hypothetical protein